MTSPDKNKNPDSQQNQQETQPEKIEELKIDAVNGCRARIKKLLPKWGFVLSLGLAAGGTGGIGVQQVYRHYTGYDPDAVATESVQISQKSADSGSDVNEKGGKLLDRAKKAWGRTKNWLGEKANNSKIVQYYNEATNGAKEAWRGLLKFGDKAVFWLAFYYFFKTGVWIAKNSINLKRELTEGVDPTVDKNMKTIVKKYNADMKILYGRFDILETDIKGIMDQVNKGAKLDLEKLKSMMEELENAKKEIAIKEVEFQKAS